MNVLAGAPIVVGADGSPRSLAAVEAAAEAAALRNRRLRIVHAFSWPSATVVTAPSLRAYRERAELCLVEALETAGKVAPDVEATAGLLPGPAAVTLLVQSRGAYEVVVGDHGQGGPGELLLGSVAEQVAAHAACPVLVVRGRRRDSGPVVVGVDGSRTSTEALERAAEEASLRGTGLHAVRVWEPDGGTELNAQLPMTYEFWAGEAEQERILSEALAGLAERFPDLPVRREVRRGQARRLLVELSRTAQLVVVGARGHGGFAGLLLGSVSRYLMHHADCPVLVARPTVPGGPRTSAHAERSTVNP